MDKTTQTSPLADEIECQVCHTTKSPDAPIAAVCTCCKVALCVACKYKWDKSTYVTYEENDSMKPVYHPWPSYPYFCRGLYDTCRNCLKNPKRVPPTIAAIMTKDVKPEDLDYLASEEIEGEPDFGCNACGGTEWHGDLYAINHYKCDECHFSLCEDCFKRNETGDEGLTDEPRPLPLRFFPKIYTRCVKCCLKDDFPKGKSVDDISLAKAKAALARTSGKYAREDGSANKKKVIVKDYCEDCDEEVDESRACTNCGKVYCKECNPDFGLVRCRATIKDPKKKRKFGTRKLCNRYFACTECFDESEGYKCPDCQE